MADKRQRKAPLVRPNRRGQAPPPRQRKYLPILFDFEKPKSRNTDQTITLLARMARFVVADKGDRPGGVRAGARLRPLASGLTPRAVLDNFATILLDTDGRALILSPAAPAM